MAADSDHCSPQLGYQQDPWVFSREGTVHCHRIQGREVYVPPPPINSRWVEQVSGIAPPVYATHGSNQTTSTSSSSPQRLASNHSGGQTVPHKQLSSQYLNVPTLVADRLARPMGQYSSGLGQTTDQHNHMNQPQISQRAQSTPRGG